MHCANEQNEVDGDKEARPPRVSFCDGLRLRRTGDGAPGVVKYLLPNVNGVPGMEVVWPDTRSLRTASEVLDAIRDGRITVEPTVGMRVQREHRDEGRVHSSGQTGVMIAWSDCGYLNHSIEFWHTNIRSGAWAILPPEQKNERDSASDGSAAPMKEPIIFSEGMKIRRPEGDIMIQQFWKLGTEAICTDANGKTTSIDLGVLGEGLLSGTFHIIEPKASPIELTDGLCLREPDGSEHVVHPGDTADTVFLAGSLAWVDYPRTEVQEMIARGELTVVDAPEAAPEFETDPHILELEAACFERDQRIVELERKLARAEAAETRATAAEQKLADLVVLGVDALPAMYPIIDVTVACNGRSVLAYRRTNGDWTTYGHRSTTFREALHAAVLAVGGKLPGDDVGKM